MPPISINNFPHKQKSITDKFRISPTSRLKLNKSYAFIMNNITYKIKIILIIQTLFLQTHMSETR